MRHGSDPPEPDEGADAEGDVRPGERDVAHWDELMRGVEETRAMIESSRELEDGARRD